MPWGPTGTSCWPGKVPRAPAVGSHPSPQVTSRTVVGDCGSWVSLGVALGRRWLTTTASCPQKQLVESRRHCGKSRGTDWQVLGYVSS